MAMLYDSLDPLIRPLALDEMGMSLRTECIDKVVELTQDETTPGFTRIKAIEAVLRPCLRGNLICCKCKPLRLHLLRVPGNNYLFCTKQNGSHRGKIAL